MRRFVFIVGVLTMAGCDVLRPQVCVDMHWRNKDGSKLYERATFPSWPVAREYVEGIDRAGLVGLDVHECILGR